MSEETATRPLVFGWGNTPSGPSFCEDVASVNIDASDDVSGAMPKTGEPLRRFFAALIDEALFLAGFAPLAAENYLPHDSAWKVSAVLVTVIFLIQVVLLVLRAQSLGKVICGLKIVAANGERASVASLVMVRTVANGLLCLVPAVGSAYFAVDSLCVFRADRRCLHDLLAGTCVVRA